MVSPGRAATLATAVFVLASGHAVAAGERQLTWRLAGGSCFPVNPQLLTDLHTAGLSFQGGAGVWLPVGVRVYLAYDFNSLFADEPSVKDYVEARDPTFNASSAVDANPTRIHTALAMAFVPLARSVAARPFALAGIGWMWAKVGDITYPDGRLGGGRDAGFAMALGGGIDFRAGYDINVFVEAVWMAGFTEDNTTQVVPVRIGVYH